MNLHNFYINSVKLETSGSFPRPMLMGFVKDQYLVSILYSEYLTMKNEAHQGGSMLWLKSGS